ncbi:MAG: tRNA (N(6)-L-threonylcarbamoyladenosine(37)-C(2))-methylthiotransferase MtaB [Planctomycetales bacterium]|nr:tRNA (N(6)-L-threonylcarbamoyladenosine(37)-C(2))-methylthiotransferase MtaB [Planctomycetales bacterium]
MRVAFVTFGCKVNQYETAAAREETLVSGRGEDGAPAVEVSPGDEADVYVVNTCTVTARADQKCRQAIRRLARRSPRARIVVAGCGVDSSREAYARLPGVAALVANREKGRLAALLGAPVPETRPTIGLRISSFPGHARAFLKIEDGCHMDCTYCIIPRVRGEVASKPPHAVRAEAEALAASGHAEIVLTGVHLGGWGRDFAPRLHLADLLPRLASVPGLRRLRLSSIEANEVTPDFVRVFGEGASEEGPFAPHLHLPLQSGSDRVLRAMKRGYRRAQVLRTVESLRLAVPGFGLTTDVIVGFPGETEDDARDTESLCREIGVSKIHRFPWSPRPGTPAASLPGRVSAPAVAERMARLAEVEAEGARAAAREAIGREVGVLVEEPDAADPDDGAGHAGSYLRATVVGAGAARGAMVRARVVAGDETGLRGVAE